MWPRRKPKPRVANNVFSAYLRGRLVGPGIGLDGEADLYADETLPVQIRVAFAIGATARRRAPILSEREVDRAVRDRLDLAAIVAAVERDERDDDGPGCSPPPVPVPMAVEETQKVRPTPWIGDPLPTGC